MERHVGLWKLENEEKYFAAELVIDGNHIEFHQCGYSEPLPCFFISQNSDQIYKVFTQGLGGFNDNKTLKDVFIKIET